MDIRTRRQLMDLSGRVLAALGALAIFGAIFLLFGFLAREVAPLLRPASAEQALRVEQDARLAKILAESVAAGVDEYLEQAFLLQRDGTFHLLDLSMGDPLTTVDSTERPPLWAGGAKASVARYDPLAGRIVVGMEDGRALPVDIQQRAAFIEGRRTVELLATVGDAVRLEPHGRSLVHIDWAAGQNREVAAGISEEGRLVVLIREETRSLFGGGQRSEHAHDLTPLLSGRATALALAPDGLTLAVGDDGGLLYQWDLANASSPRLIGKIVANGPEAGRVAEEAGRGSFAVTALAYLIGGRSLVVADAGGGVTTWFTVPVEGHGQLLQPVHRHQGHVAAVVHVAPSQRNRNFATADAAGVVKLHHSTSEQTFFSLETGAGSLGGLVMAPKNDALLLVKEGSVELWSVSNPHPEVSWKTLFGKVHYEGYPRPAYVWQSTGGSNAFEPKLSLIPLAFGTLKGTFYALIFALPLGVLGALYTSQFASKRLQQIVKPVVEVMAGLPSVVLGFLAGLWLAPLIARIFPAVVLMAVSIPLALIACAWVWRRLPGPLRERFPAGVEALLLMPLLGLVVLGSLQLGPVLESLAMRGDFRFWLFDVFGWTYDQRNSLIIGIAMGFAVIPVVFSISEDALSSVPQELVAGSLALGVTRWQTVTGVVVPTALPGIVSSVMIGIGRAVGETMIVLMATGNTPVMDFNIFNGFRALSATIAVEMPEAPVGGTLYRVLFVAALLLFLFTFFLNTLGELVRAQMRKRVERL